jgi:Stress responsive A/B Barrel Domain
MKKKVPYLLIFLCAAACQQNPADEQKIERLEMELAEAKQALAATATKAEEAQSALVHLVYLNTKADITPEAKARLTAAIARLAQIPVVKNLQSGRFKNMNDSRAMSDFDIAFQMDFKDSTAYVIYQTHPIHLELKAIAKELLEEPPVTYDYWTEDMANPKRFVISKPGINK